MSFTKLDYCQYLLSSQVNYTNSAFRSAYEQGHDKNFGIGAKVAAVTRNPNGLRYLSWKDGKGVMVHLVKDHESRQYGLLRHSLSEDNYRNWVPIEDDLKPNQIKDHGTVVVLDIERPHSLRKLTKA